jgi:hypothetical protein
MPGAQPGMSPLLNVALRAAKTVNQKIPQALFGGNKIVRRIHGTEDPVPGNTPVKCRDQPRDPELTDEVEDVNFLQYFVTAKRQLSQTVWDFFRFL